MTKRIQAPVAALVDPVTKALVGFRGPDGRDYEIGSRVDWFEIGGDITLNDAHGGRTAEITANANITLPPLASMPAGWVIELVPDGAHTIALVPSGAETVQGGLVNVTGACVVMKSRTGDRWIATGSVSA